MKKLFYHATILLVVFYTSISAKAQNANTSLSNLAATTKINVDLLPDNTNAHNLGSNAKSWKNIYVRGGSYYLDGNKFVSNIGTNNTLLGTNSGHVITTGFNNTATGFNALFANNTGGDNCAYGAYSLQNNTSGIGNIANGFATLVFNTIGYNNIAGGSYSLYYNGSGHDNIALGFQSLYNNNGYCNIAIGSHALFNNRTGVNLVAVGDSAMFNQTGSSANTAIGSKSLYANTTGIWNTAVGYTALAGNTTGNYSTAMGVNALKISNGSENDAFGGNALAFNSTGIENTAVGNGALYSNNSGSYGTAVGYGALIHNTSSLYNTAVGYAAGYTYDNGYNNVFIGAQTDVNGAGYYNVVAVGHQTICTASSQARIGNSFTTSIGGYANWTNISDVRVKKNIKQNVPGLAFINKLQPITYNLDLDAADRITQPPVAKDKAGKALQSSQQELEARKVKEQVVYTGFAAQDVEKAAKSLNYDFSGVDAAKNDKDLYGLRYSDFVVPLVKAVQELSQQNDELKQRVEKLESMMNISGQSSLNAQQSTIISSASLNQNNPNPFSNSTIINYSLPQQYASAKIMISDKSGKVIKEINISGSGKGSLQIDASSLTSGTYQYSLMVNGKLIETRQMLLAK